MRNDGDWSPRFLGELPEALVEEAIVAICHVAADLGFSCNR